MADADKKTCSKCRELKPVSAFWPKVTKAGTPYVDSACKECRKVEQRNRTRERSTTPEYKHKSKMSNIKFRYGLSKEEYINLMLEQDFRCPICTDPVGAGDWIVDHDHACCPGEKSCGNCVRALLDNKCNLLIGYAEDNRARLERANAYLEVHSANS